MSYGNRMGTRVDASPMASKSNFLAGRVNSVINQKTARHPPATILSTEEVRPPGVQSWGKDAHADGKMWRRIAMCQDASDA